MDLTCWTPETFLQNHDEHIKLLENDKNSWKKIPFLNHQKLHEIKDHTLVRFRGMIQDMTDPEIYLEKYLVKSGDNERVQEGKFRDTLVCGVRFLRINFSVQIVKNFSSRLTNQLITIHPKMFMENEEQCL